MQIFIDVSNEHLLNKLLWMLDYFDDDGVRQ